MSTGCGEGISDILRHGVSNFQSPLIITLHVTVEEVFWRVKKEYVIIP